MPVPVAEFLLQEMKAKILAYPDLLELLLLEAAEEVNVVIPVLVAETVVQQKVLIRGLVVPAKRELSKTTVSMVLTVEVQTNTLVEPEVKAARAVPLGLETVVVVVAGAVPLFTVKPVTVEMVWTAKVTVGPTVATLRDMVPEAEAQEAADFLAETAHPVT
jgi:hypothetical protein